MEGLCSLLAFTACQLYARYHVRLRGKSVLEFVFVCMCTSSQMQHSSLSRGFRGWSCCFFASESLLSVLTEDLVQRTSFIDFCWCFAFLQFVLQSAGHLLSSPETLPTDSTHLSNLSFCSTLSLLSWITGLFLRWHSAHHGNMRGSLKFSWSEKEFPAWSTNSDSPLCGIMTPSCWTPLERSWKVRSV